MSANGRWVGWVGFREEKDHNPLVNLQTPPLYLYKNWDTPHLNAEGKG